MTRLHSTNAPPSATNHHRPLPRTRKSSFAYTKQDTDPHTNKPYPPMNTVDLLKSHESRRSNRGEVDGRKQNTQISRAEEEGAGGRRISTLQPESSGQAGVRAQHRRSVREESRREERGTNPAAASEQYKPGGNPSRVFLFYALHPPSHPKAMVSSRRSQAKPMRPNRSHPQSLANKPFLH